MNFCCVIKSLMTHPSGLWLCKISPPLFLNVTGFFMGCKNSEIMEKVQRASYSSWGFSLCLAIGHGITFNGWWRVGCLFVGSPHFEHAKLLNFLKIIQEQKSLIYCMQYAFLKDANCNWAIGIINHAPCPLTVQVLPLWSAACTIAS